MIGPRLRIQLIAFFILLLVVDWFLYFRYAGHFFQGDTVYLLNHRALSVPDFWKEIVELSPSGWYRPLANEPFESILFPLVGLSPIPYRIPVYAMFVAVTGAVYLLAFMLCKRHLAAALAAFFFTVHTVNAYTTYDLGFMPELLYAFFYVVAVLAYLRYLESGNKKSYLLSLGCLVASLLSKESATTLPATLFVATLIFDNSPGSFGRRFTSAIRKLAPHMLILIAYLAFVVGHLHVMNVNVSTIFDKSEDPKPGDYTVVLNEGVFKNADLAMTWAFNLPRGSWGTWHQLTPAMVTYLKFLRALILALAVVLLISPERKAVLFASAWFWLTLLPALPLVNHFIPYYLFLSVAGLSLMVGAGFVWLYDRLRRFHMVVANSIIMLVFGSILYVQARPIAANIRDNSLLGGSAGLSASTLNDLKVFFPSLPEDMTIYFADAEQSVAWGHDFGGLIKMAYGTERVTVLYQSQGDVVFPEIEHLVVFGVHDGRLVDQTAYYRSDPTHFMKFVDSDLKLDLSAAEVITGDKYSLTVPQLRRRPIRIAYTVDGGALQIFTALLDAEGKATFNISEHTKRGLYRFWAFEGPAKAWVRTERTLLVH
jgi:hypothetical protein